MNFSLCRQSFAPAALAVALALPSLALAADKPQDAYTNADTPVVDQVTAFANIATEPSNLASNIVGATAYTLGDLPFGRVNDIIIGKSGRMIALKIGAGGTFGFDETELAVPMSDVTLKTVDGSLKVETDLAEQDVRDAANG